MSNVQWAGMIALLVVGGAILWVYMSIEEPAEDLHLRRQSSVELLQAHAAVLSAYRAAHDGAWPEDLVELRSFSKQNPELPRLGIGGDAVPNSTAGAGFYEYHVPQEDDPENVLVMASNKAHRAVLLGDRYRGKQAERSLPPVQYAIDRDLQVIEISEAEQAARAPWLQEDETAGDSESDR